MTERLRRYSSSIGAIVSIIACLSVGVGTIGLAQPMRSDGSSARTITFVADDEPVREALLRLARQAGINIAVRGDINGSVTVSLHGASVDEALTAITKPLGLTYVAAGGLVVVSSAQHAAAAPPPAQPRLEPTVLTVSTIPVDRAASVLQGLFPRDRITVDRNANAVIAVAPADDVSAMRSVLSGIDVQDALRPTTEAIQLQFQDPKVLVARLASDFPNARLTAGPNRTLIVDAVPGDINAVKAIVTTLDTAPAAPPTARPPEAVHLSHAGAQDVVRMLRSELPAVRAVAVGSSVIVSGPSGEVATAKALIAAVDQPPPGARTTEVYDLHAVDAQSAADLIARSFRNAGVSVDSDLNAITVAASAGDQRLIAEAIGRLDTSPGAVAVRGGPNPPASGTDGAVPVGSTINAGSADVEVVTLRAAIPGENLTPSTSATDIATAVTQALGQSAPDLHITVPNNSNQLVLNGSPYSIRLAKQLIDQLDVAPPLVVLDTEVLEIDETAQKDIGLLLPPALSTTYSEITPTSPVGGTPPPLLGIQPWTRTAISAQVVLNTLLTRGHARVLADPRVTTLSGHTASIRAGDQINYTTSVVNGSVGSVVTQQVQSVQTGVTLDITPIVNGNDSISVTLHPTVNSLLGTNSQGIPSIANREAQTTVTLGDDQTLVIGGLIQENTSRNESTVPILGDIPILGRLFTNYTYNTDRNELIIVVTPHIMQPGAGGIVPGPQLPAAPTPAPLPTLPAEAGQPSPTPGLPPGAASLATPKPSRAPVPSPTSSAFAATDQFLYGAPPANTYAAKTDPPRIFYASFAPTVLRNGMTVSVSAITTTNVARVTIGTGTYTTPLTSIAPAKWQASYAFKASAYALGSANTSLTLTAYRSDGATAAIQIPVSIGP
jgi:general secretion pathway protein D